MNNKFLIAVSSILVTCLMLNLTPGKAMTIPQQTRTFDCATVTDVPIVECEALVALYGSTNGAGWTDHSNWLATTEVGSWNGVYISSGHVSRLVLFNNNLVGSIPGELGDLTQLNGLLLDQNQISGSIPTELGNLSNLRDLYLNTNQLSGIIPSSLGDLDNLEYLGLSNNHISGNIPPAIGSLIGLKYLRLAHNMLSGDVPGSLTNLGNLCILFFDNTCYFDYGLDLGYNYLNWPAPEPLAGFLNIKDPDWWFTQMPIYFTYFPLCIR